MFNVQSLLVSHLAILIHHAMYATLFHGLGIVNMLGCEFTILAENEFHAEKSHSNSNY